MLRQAAAVLSRAVVQGYAVPQMPVLRLADLCGWCSFPFDGLTRAYDLDDINAAWADAESSKVIKPVIL